MTEQKKTTTIPLPVQGKDMDSIMQSLESGVEELFTSNRYQEFLKTMAKFHNYSFNNTMLIAMQRPDATLVTSYKNWQSMGRQVMKGEKGITIIAPAPYKKMKEKEVLDENQRPIMGTDGKPKTEKVEVTVPHFKAVTVFDIAQTSGEPIQTLAPELLTAAVQDFDSFMQAIQKISPVPIRFDEIDGNAIGYYHNADKEIVIKKGLSESQTLKTGGDMQAYYVDRFGFAELPDFAVQREKILDIVPEIENVDYENDLTCISFYAAECAEFPVMGEVHYDLTLPEALEAYEKIPSERMHGLKCVGFDLKDGSDYEGMQSLMIEGKIQKEFLNSIPGFRENSYVQNAISRVEKYLEERHPNVENPLESNKKVDNEKNISKEKNEKELNIQMKPIPKKKRGEMSL